MRRSILIIINALHSGGAEKTCIELARHLKGSYDLEVVGLILGGPAEEELRSMGVAVTVFHGRFFWGRFIACLRLARLLRRKKPQFVLTFLYIADLFGGVLARILVPDVRVFWNIRNNVLPRRHVGMVSYVISWINARFSRIIPDAIIYCSQEARRQHEVAGFYAHRSHVIENSPHSVRFRFNVRKRQEFRAGFENKFAFLFVGRFDPVKRVDIFIEAGARLARRVGDRVNFVIAGRDMEWSNPWVCKKIAATNMSSAFKLVGFVADQQALYSAADCLVVTSDSEGSPNSVYEAMATRLPIIIFATVGTEHITGEGINRLPSRNIDALVDLMEKLMNQTALESDRRLATCGQENLQEHPLVTFYKGTLA